MSGCLVFFPMCVCGYLCVGAQAAGMPEVICESRHATFGPLSEVEARLVRCQPPEANAPIKNVDQVKGNIVYIKRGGCSFTKKARMAQEAGAIAVVVANTDRETFGMSYTDDGQPFENIRCLACSSWPLCPPPLSWPAAVQWSPPSMRGCFWHRCLVCHQQVTCR